MDYIRKIERRRGEEGKIKVKSKKIKGGGDGTFIFYLLSFIFLLGCWSPEIAASSISESSWDGKQASTISARSWCRKTTEGILRNSIGQRTQTIRRERSVSLEKVERFARPILYYSRLYGVDPDLTRAIIWVESRGNPRSVSPKGARGLMQLMPGTARAMGVTDPFDVDQNIRGGLRYLKNLLDRLGRLERALWAYNAGPQAVREGRLPAETMSYINKVLFVRSYLNRQRRNEER